MAVVVHTSKFTDGTLSTVTGDCAGDLIVQDYFKDLTAAQLLAGDIVDIGILPAYHTVTDAILIPDDLDTNVAPAVTLDVGIMSGTPGSTDNTRTCGAQLFDASTAAQGGTPTRMTAATGFKIKPTETDRSIGVLIKAAPATAASGRVRVRVVMHQADHNVQF